MVIITFPDPETQKEAIGFLVSRFSGTFFKSGEHIVEEAALAALAEQNFVFTVRGTVDEKEVAALREVLLPNRFNDGRRVPKAWLGEATVEIMDRFSAVSADKQKVEGRWRSAGKLYKDILSRLVVDMPDTLQNRQWMKKFKARWKKKLDQLEIWMVSYLIELE